MKPRQSKTFQGKESKASLFVTKSVKAKQSKSRQNKAKIKKKPCKARKGKQRSEVHEYKAKPFVA